MLLGRCGLIHASKSSLLTRKKVKDGTVFGPWNSFVQTNFDICKWAERLGYGKERLEELHRKGLLKEIVRHGKRGVRFKWYDKYTTWHRTKSQRTGVLAKKVAMRIEKDWWGRAHPITILQLQENQVIQAKSENIEGYNSLQIGAGVGRLKKLSKPMMGHYAKAAVSPKLVIKEFRVSKNALLKPGTKILAQHFKGGQFVDIQAKTKGKGFAGVMKRHGFSGGNATHGESLTHRSAGSTGSCQDPGRVWKNKKMAGRMGGSNATVKNCRVLKVNTVDQALYVIGSVPGPVGGWVRVCDSKAKPFNSYPPFPTFFPKKYLKLPKYLHWRYSDPYAALREIDWDLKTAESLAALKAAQAAGEAEEGIGSSTDTTGLFEE